MVHTVYSLLVYRDNFKEPILKCDKLHEHLMENSSVLLREDGWSCIRVCSLFCSVIYYWVK